MITPQEVISICTRAAMKVIELYRVAGLQARISYADCGYNPRFPPNVTAIRGTQGPEVGTNEIAYQSNQGEVLLWVVEQQNVVSNFFQ
jgi:hypothetical protein